MFSFDLLWEAILIAIQMEKGSGEGMHPATCQNEKQLIIDRIFDMSTNITVLHTRKA